MINTIETITSVINKYQRHDRSTDIRYDVVLNCDCMDMMRALPDRSIDIIIADPPYGLNAGNWSDFGILRWNASLAKTKAYTRKRWDDNPVGEEYFDEVFRVSKHQIIWGVNYFFHNRLQGGRIFWDKDNPENFRKSRGELAYQSFSNIVEYYKFRWNGMFQEDMKNKEIRIHPTQKPVRLYEWLLGKYVKKNWIVLDTHVGSQSIRIACHNFGVSFIGCEIDGDYYIDGNKRYDEYISQLMMFK